MLFYRAGLPLSRQTLTYVAGIIRRYRAGIGSCWRKLPPAGQALLVLAHLRDPFAEIAAGFGVSTATAWRYVNEAVALLAARARSCAGHCGTPGMPDTPTWSSTAP